MLQWKRFAFFDREPVDLKLPENGVSCAASGQPGFVLGSMDGTITLYSRSLVATQFQAFSIRCNMVTCASRSMVLAASGEDDTSAGFVKIWDLSREATGGGFVCSVSLRTSGARSTQKVTCIALSANATVLAIGLESGALVIFSGDLAKGRYTKGNVRVDGGAVTGIHIVDDNGVPSWAYVVTEGAVFILPDLSGSAKHEVDSTGGELGMSVHLDKEIAICRADGMYVYNRDGRGPCYPAEGQKRCVCRLHGVIALAHRDEDRARPTDVVQVFDVPNKLVAFHESMGDVDFIVQGFGNFFVILKGGEVFKLTERDAQTKLETLFRRNLFSVAAHMAETHHFDAAAVAEIHRKFGDHLHQKGDHDGAIQQYVLTVGRLEPSYVIRKFLDAQRINNLTTYLQVLHEKGLANSDHTTLLLNCYTRLKDNANLNSFVNSTEVQFEIDTAIRVCKQAGYVKEAMSLAKRHKKHIEFLGMLLDSGQIHDCLDYMKELEYPDAEDCLRRYGKRLLNVHTDVEVVVSMMGDICIGSAPEDDSGHNDKQVDVNGLLSLLDGRPRLLCSFLDRLHSSRPSILNGAALLTLLEMYLDNIVSAGDEPDEESIKYQEKCIQLLKNETVSVDLDLDHALMLCRSRGFVPGVTAILERQGLFFEILQLKMEEGDAEAVVQACDLFGEREHSLWVHALSFLTSQSQINEQLLFQVLAHIEEHQLMPPLMVVQTLAENSTASLGSVSGLILRHLKQIQSQIEDDSDKIKQYHKDTDKMRQEVQDLKTKPQVFQSRNCSACGTTLDLPSVHFLCIHSFHQRCLGEHDKQCPVCERQASKVLEMKKSLDQPENLHEQFFRYLKGSEDGFRTVSEFFGRGLFSPSTQQP